MPLLLRVNENHGWDYAKQEFVDVPEKDIELEHCLLAIARWESKWKTPFFVDHLTNQQWTDYIGFMALDVPDFRFAYSLNSSQIKQVIDYIQESQTATWFSNEDKSGKKEQMTSELIYYYMAQVPLPFDVCERWHLTRLMSILRIASIKSQPEKKMPFSQLAAQNRALNAARKAKLHK